MPMPTPPPTPMAIWTKEDHEIFDLVSALEAAEGKGTSFYSHLGVDPSATQGELTKAYRKRSLELHPDKNPGVKDIQERFARMGVIAQILRSPESRERYNFFYKNGVPKWRGTGYYYSRYRPTLSHTLLFLVLLTAGAHRLVMQLNHNRDIRRVAYFENAALVAAGVKRDGAQAPAQDKEKSGLGRKETGNGTSTNGAGNVHAKGRRRKVKVPMVQGMEGAGYLELVVEGEHVYLPHDDGTITPLSTLAQTPSFLRTWPFTLSLSISRKALSYLPASVQSNLPASLQSIGEDIVSDEESDDGPEDTPTPAPRRRGRANELRKGDRGRGSGASTPATSSPGTTEVESEGEDAAGGEGVQKKKRGPGKAAAMRRRKMGKGK
ncbi:hypothetical protein JCM24511_05185 [Saitozyma sp. JCM 24511]|nr:hypothetical protein JCM24511_05185 [Saitozyma sp. JCM 24511]